LFKCRIFIKIAVMVCKEQKQTNIHACKKSLTKLNHNALLMIVINVVLSTEKNPKASKGFRFSNIPITESFSHIFALYYLREMI